LIGAFATARTLHLAAPRMDIAEISPAGDIRTLDSPSATGEQTPTR
jgi:hypothetical protein